jgi:phosphoenolpyruvate carboxylase
MVLRELLEASEPALAQVVAMLKAAENMTDAAKERMRKDMDQTITSLENKAEQALALAAGVTSDLVAQAEAIRGRRPGRQVARKRSAGKLAARSEAPSKQQQAVERPPSSNRGVKSPDNTTKTIAKSPDIRPSKAKKEEVF